MFRIRCGLSLRVRSPRRVVLFLTGLEMLVDEVCRRSLYSIGISKVRSSATMISILAQRIV